MRSGLIEKDGWSSSDKLPEKWLFREYFSKGKRSFTYQNHEYELFSSGAKVLQELVMKDYSERQINLFIGGFIDPSINPEEIIWENESVIPKPWKIGKTLNRRLFVTPSGTMFYNKNRLLKFVQNSIDITLNTKSIIFGYVRKAIKKKYNRQNAGRNAESPSEELELDLPVGWESVKDPNQRKFFRNGARGKSFRGLEAVRYMISNNDPVDEIEKMKTSAFKDGKWATTEYLPPGWRVKEYNNIGRSKKLLSPTLEIMNFDAAIAQMESKGVTESDILKIKKGYDWEEHEDLPKGWLHSFRYDGEKFKYRSFLSPDYRAINGVHMLLKHFKSMDYVDQKDMDKVNNFIEQDGWKRVNGIPDGWHFKENKTESQKIKRYFLSEKGDRLKSARDALKYLLANNFPQNIIDNFRRTFNPTLGKKAEDTLKNTQKNKEEIKEEISKDVKQVKTVPEPKKKLQKTVENIIETNSYVEKDFLPQGWQTNGRYYRSPDGQTLKTLHETVKAMKIKCIDETEIEKVKMNGSQIPFMKKSNLPAGWMVAIMKGGENMIGGAPAQRRYLSPEGRIFMSRASTIKFMVDNSYPKSDIDIMKSLLISEDNWEVDQNLPDGWMIKQMGASPVLFLSPTWESMRHKSNVLNYMKKQGYTDAVIVDAKKYLYDNPKFMFFESRKKRIKAEPDDQDEELKPPKKKAYLDSEVIEWKSGDSSVSENWLVTRKSDNSILISNPKGEKFSRRIEAIASMIKKQQSPGDIFRMWKHLHLEGWVCDEDNLPSGWRRKYLEELGTYHYLSPLMVVIKSPGALLNHMESSQEYSAQDIAKVKLWINSL